MDRKSKKLDEIQGYCRSQLASIISEGLQPFPPCVFDVEVLLGAPVIDLNKVGRALDADAGFSHRVLRFSNTILVSSHESAQNVTDAAVLLGPCLFHTAVLICAVTEFGPLVARDSNAEALWSHSVQVAIKSERIAELSEYSLPGTAYVAGLLHDIGYLPLRIVAREQEKTFNELTAIEWRDNINLEREIFGLDHCQIGRWMAKSWGFSPSLTEAVLHHHDPDKAGKDAPLAEIVYAAESYCSEPSSVRATDRSGIERTPPIYLM